MSFGKVVVVKKDGSQGAFFDVTSDVTIGRDKSCDIRIKLSAVSRHHAKMSIDENGHCILESISKTNPTFLNGSTMDDISRLQDGDIITVGDRSFIFQNAKISPAKMALAAKENAILRQVPVAASFDDSQTLNFSKAPMLQALFSAKKEGLQSDNIITCKTPTDDCQKPAPENPQAEQQQQNKKPISTPLKKAINDRRQSFAPIPTPTPSTAPGVVVVGETVPLSSATNGPNVTVVEAPAKKSLKTPLKKAINDRRQSFAPVALTMSEQVIDDCRNTPAPAATPQADAKGENAEDVAAPKKAGLKTPIKNAINSRRQSFAPPSTSSIALDHIDAAKPTSIDGPVTSASIEPVAAPTKKSLKTPLKKAINDRRRSFAPPNVVPVVDASSSMVVDAAKGNKQIVVEHVETDAKMAAGTLAPTKKNLKTPLKQAINSRRQSYGNSIAQDIEADPVTVTNSIKAPDTTGASAESFMITSRVLNTPMKQAIVARRQSYDGPTASSALKSRGAASSHATSTGDQGAAETENKTKRSIQTPLKQAIVARRQSYSGAPAPVPVPAGAAQQVTTALPKVISTPMKQAIVARRQSFPAPAPHEQQQQPESRQDQKKQAKILSTPLKAAISARRQSFSTAATAPLAQQAIPAEPVEVERKAEVDEIETKDEEPSAEVHEIEMKGEEPAAEVHEIEMKGEEPVTELHENEMKGEEPAAEVHEIEMKGEEPSAEVHEIEMKGEEPVTEVHTMEVAAVEVVSTEEQQNAAERIQELKDNLIRAITSRKASSQKASVVCKAAVAKLQSKASKGFAFGSGRFFANTPLRTKRPPLRAAVVKKSAAVSEVAVDSNIEEEVAEDLETASQKDVDISNNSSTSGAELTSMEVNAVNLTCAQISVDAFANELELQGHSPEDAYSEAVQSFLQEPANFAMPSSTADDTDLEEGEIREEIFTAVDAAALSPAPTKPTRRRESLLGSLEKKGRDRVLSINAFMEHDTEAEELSCELVSNLTEGEMALVDAYAKKLEESAGLSSDDAYGLALDAFLTGLQRCHSHTTARLSLSSSIEAAVAESVVTQVAVDVEMAAEGLVKEEICEANEQGLDGKDEEEDDAVDFFGASLRSLFHLPAAYVAANEDTDAEMVTTYAEEMNEYAGVDPAIAYGIALDSFLADPAAFRDHFVKHCAKFQHLRIDDDIDVSANLFHSEVEATEEVLDVAESVKEETAPATPIAPKAKRSRTSSTPLASTRASRSANKKVPTPHTPTSAKAPSKAPSPSHQEASATSPTEGGNSEVPVTVEVPTVVASSRRTGSKRSHSTVKFSAQVASPAPATPDRADLGFRSPAPKRGRAQGRKQTPHKILQAMEEEADDAEPVLSLSVASPTVALSASPLASPQESDIVAPTESAMTVTEVVATKPETNDTCVEVVEDVAMVMSPAKVESKMDGAEEKVEDKVSNDADEPQDDEVRSTRKSARKPRRGGGEVESTDLLTTATGTSAAATPGKTRGRQPRAASSVDEVAEKDQEVAPTRSTRRTAAAGAVSDTPSKGSKGKAAPKPKSAPTSASSATNSTRRNKKSDPVSELFEKGKEEEDDGDEEEEVIALLCDGCDGEFIMEELGLAEVPEGDWFCNDCVKAPKGSKKGKNNRSRK